LEASEYAAMFEVEDVHWWYQGMEHITGAILQNLYPNPENLAILDAGCGTGRALRYLFPEFGKATGVDISPLALSLCRRRDLHGLSQADVTALPFPSANFDLVTSFDVLYSRHVAHDLAALLEFHRVLKPKGHLLIRLPAYPWLSGKHGIVVHTARRYTRSSLSELLHQSGFVVQHLSYANCFLFPFVALKRLGERLAPSAAPQSDLGLGNGIFNPLLLHILSAEAPRVVRTGLPFGSSVIAVARKS
jgi:SAM-dependent methyltransferase